MNYSNTVGIIPIREEDQLLNPYSMFKYSVRSEVTRKYYERRLRIFFDFIQFEPEVEDMEKRCSNFVATASDDYDWAFSQTIKFFQFQKDRVGRREIKAATLRNFIKSLKAFCDSADLNINWKKITKGLPKSRQSANDRAPTIEEIQKIVEYPDRRIKPIVCVMASSGIRLGAWDYLQWKHVEPIYGEGGDVIAAKLRVYAGDAEEYYSFITAEAYMALKDWIDFRTSYGEKITGDSWIMRDLWQTTNMNYGARWGLATNPKKLKSSGVKSLLERAVWDQGVRKPLTENENRHEWKLAHGYRKFYKSRAEQIMKPINVELTMGHDIGISACYYKPKEQEVLEDYLKAAELLTINGEQLLLQKKLEELSAKTDDHDYLLRARLQGKDDAIQSMKVKYDSDITLLKEAISDMQQLLRNPKELQKISRH